MNLDFYSWKPIVALLCVGGIARFARDIVAGLRYLYRVALTPEGAAVMRIVTALLAAATLAFVVLRG